MKPIRLLFLSDTHLGFDMPLSPRVDRRRRGPDFFQAYRAALASALAGQVDLVVHGGDLFFKSRVHQTIVSMAFAPLIEIANRGIPVFMVPGNHERSFFPRSLFDTHPQIHIFSKPETRTLEIRGLKISLSGFPCIRNGIRTKFPQVLDATDWEKQNADIRLLCMHQTVEGAVAGIQKYLFRQGNDIIAAQQLPPVTAVLAGHIHTSQILRQDLKGRQLPAPVFYGGSTERTSFVERAEPKGFWDLRFSKPQDLVDHGEKDYIELETRPMILLEMDPSMPEFRTYLAKQLKQLPEDAVVRIRLDSIPLQKENPAIPTLTELRAMVPSTMTIDLTMPGNRQG